MSWWFGAVRQQATDWANIDQDLSCHRKPLRHNVLIWMFTQNYFCWVWNRLRLNQFLYISIFHWHRQGSHRWALKNFNDFSMIFQDKNPKFLWQFWMLQNGKTQDQMLHMGSSHIWWPLLGVIKKICKVFLLYLKNDISVKNVYVKYTFIYPCG